ncbi:hypothetical protein JXA59_01165 [Patescibacteria group bacterium]|nr:hypothetical protein [Patescibacteria group bacterium]
MTPTQWGGMATVLVCIPLLYLIVRALIRDLRATREIHPFVQLGGTALVVMDSRPRSHREHDWTEKLLVAMTQLDWGKFVPVSSYTAFNRSQAVARIQDDPARFLVTMCIDEPAGMAELALFDRSGKTCFSLSRIRLGTRMDFKRWVSGLSVVGLWDEIALSEYHMSHPEVSDRNFQAWKARQP